MKYPSRLCRYKITFIMPHILTALNLCINFQVYSIIFVVFFAIYEPRKQRFCKIFALEWASNVTQYAIYDSSYAIRQHDPERLPAIDITHGSKRRRYRDGKLHNLREYVNVVFTLKTYLI